MKICDQYSHYQGLETLQAVDGILKEITEIVTADGLSFGTNSPSEIKKIISLKFNANGWADKVRVGSSKLTISFVKSKIGVCFQIGNVARTYADVLKLMHLNKKGIINVGVIIVPHKIESKKMGANYAQYDRLIKELSQFNEIITFPILVIGLSN